jgi:ferredoxin
VGGGIVKIAVDADLCTGHGRCYRLAPGLLTYDDEGYVSIRGGAIDVPADQVEAAEEAEGTCPEGAIRLIYDED